MSKRILVLATTFPRWKDDTEPAFVYYLSDLLAQRGFSMTVLAPHSSGSLFRERLGNVNVRRFSYAWPHSMQKICYNGGALPNLKRYWRARLQLPVFLLRQWNAILKLVEQDSWDLIHAHWIVPQGFFATVIGRMKHIPVILTAHAGDVFAMRNPVIRPFATYALRKALLCTVNSNATVEAVLKLYKDSTVSLVPMGVDLSRFHPGLPDEEIVRRFDLRGRTILGVGRFAPKKGFLHLIDACSSLVSKSPDYRLLLCGFGPQEESLRARVAERNLEGIVHFAGKINQNELPRFYRSSQVVSVPSVVLSSGDTEGQGIVVLEAMASRIPVVASGVGGILDTITHDRNGILVPPGDPASLADAIYGLCEDERKADLIARNGLETIRQRFSWDRIADRFAALYENILQ